MVFDFEYNSIHSQQEIKPYVETLNVKQANNIDMYAIVDIETTGGHANSNGITEVAIRIHNGVEVIESYETLINPGMPIPYFITALTGISNELVNNAPFFSEVAADIFRLLSDKIFVAHNVNFDYSFLQYHLNKSGFNLQVRKLCTVRLGRKILPGLPSYSLGKFCNHVGIANANRHRAGGDAEATALLFSMLIKNDQEGHIKKSLNVRSKEQSLPPHVSKKDIDNIPASPGIYYFHNAKGKVIYVGKAKNLKKRVNSHFLNNSPGKQKQVFLRDIYSVTFKECGTELMALIHEAIEIKRLWPANNRALKRYEHSFALYTFEDQNGFKRLAIDKIKNSLPGLYTFNLLTEGYALLKKMVDEFELCGRLCYIQKNNPCQVENCPVCSKNEGPENYNLRVNQAISNLKISLPSFLVVDEGRLGHEKSLVLMENGKFFGTGFLDSNIDFGNLEEIKSQLTPYPSNDYIRNLIYSHVFKFPEKMLTV